MFPGLGRTADPMVASAVHHWCGLYWPLMVRYNWRDHQLTKMEPWLHAIVWSMAAVIAVFPIPLQMYNFTDTMCWIAPSPLGFDDSRYGEEATCTRGENAWIFGIAFTVFPAWLCFAASIVLMAMIYHTVRNMENKVSVYATIATQPKTSAAGMARQSNEQNETGVSSSMVESWSEEPDALAINEGKSESETFAACTARQSNEQKETGGSKNMGDTGHKPDTPTINRAKSEAVAWRDLGIACGFCLTYVLDLAVVILWYDFRIYNRVLSIVAYILYPLQGFTNLMVFIRKRDTMKTPEGRFAKRLFCRERSST